MYRRLTRIDCANMMVRSLSAAQHLCGVLCKAFDAFSDTFSLSLSPTRSQSQSRSRSTPMREQYIQIYNSDCVFYEQTCTCMHMLGAKLEQCAPPTQNDTKRPLCGLIYVGQCVLYSVFLVRIKTNSRPIIVFLCDTKTTSSGKAKLRQIKEILSFSRV